MADRGRREPEVLYCHACHNEWNRELNRNEHELECPECHSGAVELVSLTDLVEEISHQVLKIYG